MLKQYNLSDNFELAQGILLTNLQDFILRTLDGGDSIDLRTQNYIFPNLGSLANTVLAYHSDRQNKNSAYILEQRKRLAAFASKYATSALSQNGQDDSIFSLIQSKIDSLSRKDPSDVILLMTAHQPNLFPYSGVTRKIALMIALSEAIEKSTRGAKEVVCLYGVADHDFVHNKWIRSAELPAPLRKEGTLRYNVKIPQKDIMLPANRIPKPLIETLNDWKAQTLSWINENSRMAEKYLKLHTSKEEALDPNEFDSIALKNKQDFWRLVEGAHSISQTLAEFSSILLFRIVAEIWEVPVLFANFSDCFTSFGPEYSWMLDNVSSFSDIIKSNETKLKSNGIDSGLAEDIGEVFPLWLKCPCGSKYRLSQESKTISGRCQRCGSEISYSTQKLKELAQTNPEVFEPRSITMPIAFARSVDMSCYIGGVGGLGYLMHTREISDRFQSPLPPTPFWYVDDIYTSIELLCSVLQVERLAKVYSVELLADNELDVTKIEEECAIMISGIQSRIESGKLPKSPVTQRDVQLLMNIKTSLKAKGCMLDYAINVGLKSNFVQWLEFLRNDGRLHRPVPLRTSFEV